MIASRAGAADTGAAGATAVTVALADPAAPEALQLLEELSAALAGITGDSGRASFDAADVRVDKAGFVIARDQQGRALGCGALRPLQQDVAELKRMYARPGTRGVGAALLAFLEQQAASFGYQALWLETRCVNQRAVAFYQQHGYGLIDNFGKYAGNPAAVCLAKALPDNKRRDAALPAQQVAIDMVTLAGFEEFLGYMAHHLDDNGAHDGLYFQPLSRSQSSLPSGWAAAFRAGLQTPVGQAGWRRLWVARTAAGSIVGHVDLRAHGDDGSRHRCQLGIGVHRLHRQRGLGRVLLEHAERWALDEALFGWIDLQVLSENAPALNLYRRAGYTVLSDVADMFRIDGRSLAYTSMTKLLVA